MDSSFIAVTCSVVSILGTVAVGIYGLRHEYRDADGKLKIEGRILTAGMAVLGAISILSGYYERRENSEKEKKSDKLRDQYFDKQMLYLIKLQDSMFSSLRMQQDIFSKADTNIHISGLLQRQARDNTNNLLRHVLEEGNRLSSDRIAVSVSYKCPIVDRKIAHPALNNVTLQVTGRSGDTLSLTTAQQLSLDGATIFVGFVGDLGPFETFPGWVGARVSIGVNGRIFYDGSDMVGILTLEEFNNMTEAEIAERERPAIRPKVCPLSASLMLNGRTVLRSRSSLNYINSDLYRADVRNIPINNARLSLFVP